MINLKLIVYFTLFHFLYLFEAIKSQILIFWSLFGSNYDQKKYLKVPYTKIFIIKLMPRDRIVWTGFAYLKTPIIRIVGYVNQINKIYK